MTIKFSNIEKAGRLLRLSGWLMLIPAIGIAASILLPLYVNDDFGGTSPFIMYLLVLFIFLSFLTLFIGKAVKNNKKWAKISGLFISTLLLISPPIGTVLALIIYYYLYKGWSENHTII